jgi:hypothetical protein
MNEIKDQTEADCLRDEVVRRMASTPPKPIDPKHAVPKKQGKQPAKARSDE